MNFRDVISKWSNKQIERLFEYVGNGGKLAFPGDNWTNKSGNP